MRNDLKLRYKRVSWRSPKIQTNKFRQKKLGYIHFIKTCSNENYIVIQINKFTVNKFT